MENEQEEKIKIIIENQNQMTKSDINIAGILASLRDRNSRISQEIQNDSLKIKNNYI